MTTTQLNTLLQTVLTLEHRTKETLGRQEYESLAALARDCEAPEFIVQYFTNKAAAAN
jgi:hypothetical protein